MQQIKEFDTSIHSYVVESITQENCNFFASGSSEFYYILGLEVKQENEKEEETVGRVRSRGIKWFSASAS